MINNHHIIRILREAALLLNHDYDPESLHFVEVNNRSYHEDEFTEFKRDLFEAANKIQIMMLQYHLSPQDFKTFIEKEEQFVLAFRRTENGFIPVIIHPAGKRRMQTSIESRQAVQEAFNEQSTLYTDENQEIIFFVLFPQESLVSDFGLDETSGGKTLNPITRLIRLLHAERSQINYIFFFALVTGLISLVLPLGIQATVELISGGVFFSSVYVLIGIVILGVVFGGILQIIQISLVEHLQRRIFTKASLEFAYRIPRLKAESIISNYAPELVNRFFDIITI